MMAGELASVVPSRINMVIKRKKRTKQKNHRSRQPPIQYLVLLIG
ncbi:unnamed protein product [Musa banksii]